MPSRWGRCRPHPSQVGSGTGAPVLGRSLCSLLARSFVCECHTISAVPRFQLPPRRTQHADFPHCALLLASPQGLWGLSCRSGFQRWSNHSVPALRRVEQPPLPTLAGFVLIAEYVASHSRTNSLSSMLRETSAARPTAASTFVYASDASAQPAGGRPERQNDGHNSRASPRATHCSLHRPRDEDVPPTKTAGREDDRKARGFPNQGRPEKDRPRKPRDRRRAAGAQLKCRADGVSS